MGRWRDDRRPKNVPTTSDDLIIHAEDPIIAEGALVLRIYHVKSLDARGFVCAVTMGGERKCQGNFSRGEDEEAYHNALEEGGWMFQQEISNSHIKIIKHNHDHVDMAEAQTL